jgi:hypothetical protein
MLVLVAAGQGCWEHKHTQGCVCIMCPTHKSGGQGQRSIPGPPTVVKVPRRSMLSSDSAWVGSRRTSLPPCAHSQQRALSPGKRRAVPTAAATYPQAASC